MEEVWSDVQAVAAFERSTQARHTPYTSLNKVT